MKVTVYHSFTIQETIKHFEAINNLRIPESTIRGLRKSYLNTLASKTDVCLSKSKTGGVQQGNGPVFDANDKNKDTKPMEELSELHCSKRGRPIRLGKVLYIHYN